MMNAAMIFLVLGIYGAGPVNAADLFEKDVIKTTAGNLEITFIGHGSLMLKFGGKVICPCQTLYAEKLPTVKDTEKS
jgi:hypothetical protein